MDNQQLLNLQAQLFNYFGFKIDLHHSEEHRGILVVKHDQPLKRMNVIHAISY